MHFHFQKPNICHIWHQYGLQTNLIESIYGHISVAGQCKKNFGWMESLKDLLSHRAFCLFLQRRANKQGGLVGRHSPNCQWVIEVKCQCPAREEERGGNRWSVRKDLSLSFSLSSLFLSFVSFFPTPPILLSSRNGHCRCYILAVASHNSEKFNSDFSTKTFHVLIKSIFVPTQD